MSYEEYMSSDVGKLPIMERQLCWVDVLYQAAVEAVKDKHILITRYPIELVA